MYDKHGSVLRIETTINNAIVAVHRCIDDGPGKPARPSPGDPRHVLGGDAKSLALLHVEDDAVEIHDPVLGGNRESGARRGFPQRGEDTLADGLVPIVGAGFFLNVRASARSGRRS